MTIPPPPPPLVLAAGRLKARGAAGWAAAVGRSSSKRPALLLRPMTMPDRCAGCGGGWGRVLGNAVSPATVAMAKMVTITLSLNSDVLAMLCFFKLIEIRNNKNLLLSEKPKNFSIQKIIRIVFDSVRQNTPRIRMKSINYWTISNTSEGAVVKNLWTQSLSFTHPVTY
jgi:hypothetical protein